MQLMTYERFKLLINQFLNSLSSEIIGSAHLGKVTIQKKMNLGTSSKN